MSHVDVTKRAIWQDSEVHAMLTVIKELDVLRKIDGRTQRNKQIFMSLQEDSAEQQIFHSWSVCEQRSDDFQQFMHLYASCSKLKIPGLHPKSSTGFRNV